MDMADNSGEGQNETLNTTMLWLIGLFVACSIFGNLMYTIFVGPIPTDYPSGHWATPPIACEVQQCP